MRRRPRVVDRVHAVDVGPGAEAAAARLDPEQVVEHARRRSSSAAGPRGWRRPSETIASRSSSGLPRISICGFAAQDASARRAKSCSRRRISSAPTASLSANTSPARIDSTIAGVPPSSRISGSGWYECPVGVTNRIVPPPGTDGTRLRSSAALGDEHAGRARAADELVRREEDRVLVGEVAVGTSGAGFMSIGRYGPGGRVVPARRARRGGAARSRPASTSVTIPVTFDAAEKLPIFSAPVGVAAQLVLEVVEVDAAVGVLADRDDVGDRLAPRQLVRVVLVGPDEDDRPLAASRRAPGGG